MLIIHPPLTKPCEPPAALAYLAGALRLRGVSSTVCDMNIEALHFLMKNTRDAEDTWTRRAVKNLSRNITALQTSATYQNRDKYHRAVSDINRILEVAGKKVGIQLSLANYVDEKYSPLKSNDLKRAAANYMENIFFSYFAPRLDQLLETTQATTLGISLNYLSQAICSFAMIGYLRTKHPKIKIVVGGGLITTWLSHKGWRQPFGTLIDTYIGGKGENQLLSLFGKAEACENSLPTYGQLQNNYFSPGFVLPYTTSRGCFWKKCNFCPETSEDNPYEHIAPGQTLSQLATLSAQTRPTLIHLLDNAISSSTLRAIVQERLTVPWYGFARFSRQLADKVFCHQLRQSGCIMLKLGLESGDQNVLNQMNKGIDLQLASTILHNLQDAGIATYIYLLFGTPEEDLESACRTQEFVEEHHLTISFLNLAIFNLPVCSHETKHLRVSDFYDGDLSIYSNFEHPKGWNRKAIRHFLDTSFKRSPEITPILHNDPPFFTSNHAPFISLQAKLCR